MTAAPPIPVASCSRMTLLARDIKFSHSVFALPWALLATFLAAGGWPKPIDLLLILVCMVSARTVAMSVNRLLDARLDALNPRTARRALPSGGLTRTFYWSVVAFCSIAFIVATAGFWRFDHNLWPLALSVPTLAALSVYPLLKRFTRLCHYYLGMALGIAPICAWIAVGGPLSVVPVLIGVAVLLWTAGFDIIYACQDYESDLTTGTVSVPARVGIARALMIARVTHVLSFAAMIAAGVVAPSLGTFYFIGVACAGVLLVVEHSLVRPTDLSKVGLAFFTVNGAISVLVGTLGIVDVLMRHGA